MCDKCVCLYRTRDRKSGSQAATMRHGYHILVWTPFPPSQTTRNRRCYRLLPSPFPEAVDDIGHVETLKDAVLKGAVSFNRWACRNFERVSSVQSAFEELALCHHMLRERARAREKEMDRDRDRQKAHAHKYRGSADAGMEHRFCPRHTSSHWTPCGYEDIWDGQNRQLLSISTPASQAPRCARFGLHPRFFLNFNSTRQEAHVSCR